MLYLLIRNETQDKYYDNIVLPSSEFYLEDVSLDYESGDKLYIVDFGHNYTDKKFIRAIERILQMPDGCVSLTDLEICNTVLTYYKTNFSEDARMGCVGNEMTYLYDYSTGDELMMMWKDFKRIEDSYNDYKAGRITEEELDNIVEEVEKLYSGNGIAK